MVFRTGEGKMSRGKCFDRILEWGIRTKLKLYILKRRLSKYESN